MSKVFVEMSDTVACPDGVSRQVTGTNVLLKVWPCGGNLFWMWSHCSTWLRIALQTEICQHHLASGIISPLLSPSPEFHQ
jgi:hypothetical protein